MAESFGDKSQEATPHRREQARREGHVAKSQDLSSALLLIAALLALLYLGQGVVQFMGQFTEQQLGSVPWLTIDRTSVVADWHAIVFAVGRVMLPLFGILMLAALIVNVSQIGLVFLPQKLALDITRIDPLKGLTRLFSISNAVRLSFGVFKILVVAGVAFASLWSQREQILQSSALDVPQIAVFVTEITLWTCLKIGLALLVLALLDYAYQRWKHERDLRMSPQEVREEMKQLQGDPQIIARRRSVQRQLVLNRLNTTVPKADVVVTNPTELAIALKYDPDTMPAPIVLAKGAGIIAQRIRRLALENNIPVVERKELARILYKQVDVNQAIPAQQYAVVAEVLRYVYELKGDMPAALQNAA